MTLAELIEKTKAHGNVPLIFAHFTSNDVQLFALAKYNVQIDQRYDIEFDNLDKYRIHCEHVNLLLLYLNAIGAI